MSDGAHRSWMIGQHSITGSQAHRSRSESRARKCRLFVHEHTATRWYITYGVIDIARWRNLTNFGSHPIGYSGNLMETCKLVCFWITYLTFIRSEIFYKWHKWSLKVWYQISESNVNKHMSCCGLLIKVCNTIFCKYPNLFI